jgi:hypothetical protein
MGLDKSACVNQSQKLLDDGQIGSNRICLVSGLARPVPHAPLKIKTTPESSELKARLVERLTQIRRKVLKSSLLGAPLFSNFSISISLYSFVYGHAHSACNLR